MAYQLAATKLQTYYRCPQAYYFRYELGLKTPGFFGNAKLGTALHQTLAKAYRDWTTLNLYRLTHGLILVGNSSLIN